MLSFLWRIKSKTPSIVGIIPGVFLLIYVRPLILLTATSCLTNWNTTVSGALDTNGFLSIYVTGVNLSL